VSYLGIEIGGTKLQLAIGDGQRVELSAFERRDVLPDRGAQGILAQIQDVAQKLLAEHSVARIGIGFGGPIDTARGIVTKSHQIDGWENFPLVQWCRDTLGLPALLGNDCDSAALGEARFGAGQGCGSVFFTTVGTGIGGGFVVDGRLLGQGRPAVSEIGHLRPGLEAIQPTATVESIASGAGIEAAVRRSLNTGSSPDCQRQELLTLCDGDPDCLTAKLIAQSARRGNLLAQQALNDACQTLGWAIAQVVALLAPEVVVVGGGVSLIGNEWFFEPLRRATAKYVFPPLARSYQIVPAQLGEEVVVHGAIALAAQEQA